MKTLKIMCAALRYRGSSCSRSISHAKYCGRLYAVALRGRGMNIYTTSKSLSSGNYMTYSIAQARHAAPCSATTSTRYRCASYSLARSANS